MLVSPQFNGLDLPVHEPGIEIVDKTDLHLATETIQNPTFVRDIAFDVPEGIDISLAELLRRTDEELEYVAELCGITVLRHEWGLMPLEDSHDKVPHEYSKITGVPDAHTVVAEVDTLVKSQSSDTRTEEEQQAAYDRLTEGMEMYRKLSGLRLRDMFAYQVMHRVIPRTGDHPAGSGEQSEGNPSRAQDILVDIEPWFV